jgi:hypothetical protein
MKVIPITLVAAVALDGSIAKWQGIVSAFVEADGTDEAPDYTEDGLKDCPLCIEFNRPSRARRNDPDDPQCKGCPIFADTSVNRCDGTPYDEWRCDETQANAETMLGYLEDLKSRAEVIQPEQGQ